MRYGYQYSVRLSARDMHKPRPKTRPRQRSSDLQRIIFARREQVSLCCATPWHAYTRATVNPLEIWRSMLAVRPLTGCSLRCATLSTRTTPMRVLRMPRMDPPIRLLSYCCCPFSMARLISRSFVLVLYRSRTRVKYLERKHRREEDAGTLAMRIAALILLPGKSRAQMLSSEQEQRRTRGA